ncbi:MAG: sulfur carrier protein ThiS [Chloroflexota bacterium]
MNPSHPTFIINGQMHPLLHPSLEQALAASGFDPAQAGTAVAVNAVVVPRAGWRRFRLQPGDRVEVIQAVAGG